MFELSFGDGWLIVDTGRIDSKPAVFISKTTCPGVVGESSSHENHAPDRLLPDDVVLLFPTMEQAEAVADALVWRPRS